MTAKRLCGLVGGVIALMLFSCSPVRNIRPLEEGETRVSAALGGPITYVGKTPIPLPLLSLGYSYGFNEKFNLQGGFHVTSAIYKVAHLEVGGDYRLFEPEKWRPGIIFTPKLYLTTNFEKKSLRIYPDLLTTLPWKINDNVWMYAGFESWFVLANKRPDGNKQKRNMLVVPFLGTEIGNQKWQCQIESRYYVPYINTELSRAVQNVGINDMGILGVFVGVSRSFGGAQ